MAFRLWRVNGWSDLHEILTEAALGFPLTGPLGPHPSTPSEGVQGCPGVATPSEGAEDMDTGFHFMGVFGMTTETSPEICMPELHP